MDDVDIAKLLTITFANLRIEIENLRAETDFMRKEIEKIKRLENERR